MLIVISPAKTLNMEVPAPSDFYTTPQYLEKSQQINKQLLRKKTSKNWKNSWASAPNWRN